MRKFVRGFFIAITFCAIVIYFLACCSTYISPTSFWPMTFLGLAFPIIATCFFVFIIAWFFIRWKFALVLLTLFLIAGFPNMHATFAFNFPKRFNRDKEKNSLRILSWNIRGFDSNSWASDSATSVRRQMINYIKAVNPDVLLLQEFTDWKYPGTYSNIDVLRDSLNFSYHYTTSDSTLHFALGTLAKGCGIFSKFPITDSGKIGYTNVPENICFADILFQNKPVRFYTTHLLSTGIHPKKEYGDGYKQYSKLYKYVETVLERLKYYDRIHVEQAKQLKKEVDQSKISVIVTGDLNSVPSSYVYHTIKGQLKDAFIEKGSKLGHTYIGLSKTLRIDYVFVHPDFNILQVASPRLYLSDHFPTVVDIQWNKK